MSKNYYISLHGNDQNEGTLQEHPFRSINRVNQLSLKPGDQILFEGGSSFKGNLIFENYQHSLEAQPIVIGSYGKGKAHIDAGKGNGIYVLNSGGFHIQDLIITGEGRDKNPRHGILFYLQSKTEKRLRNFSLTNVDISGFNKGGITFYADEKTTPLGFRDIDIKHASTHHNGDHGISISGKVNTKESANKNIHIAHCQAFKNYGELGKTHSHTGNGIVVGNSHNVLIEYCEAYENGKDNIFSGGGPVGIWLWDCRFGKIRFSESHHNRTGSKVDGGGFDLDGGCQNCSLEHNISHNNDGAGYLIAEYDGANPLIGNSIRQNISINDGLKNNYGGIFLWRGDGMISNLNIYENLIFSKHSSTGFKVVSDSITGVKLVNNVFITDGNADLVNLSDTVEDLLFRNNHFFSVSGKYSYQDMGKSYSDLAIWAQKGQSSQSQGKEGEVFFDAIDWEQNIENSSYWRSIRTLIMEFSDPDFLNPQSAKEVNWQEIFSSPKPDWVPPPLRFIAIPDRSGFYIHFEVDPIVTKVIIELKRDFESTFEVIKEFSQPNIESSFHHLNPFSGRNHYRLKLQDANGGYIYSPVSSSEVFDFSPLIEAIYYQQKIELHSNYAANSVSFLHAKLIDTKGNSIQNWEGKKNEPLHILKLNKPLTPDVYILELTSSLKGKKYYQKIFID